MRKWLFKLLFQKLVPFSWIDGNKTSIAKWFTFISAVLLVGTQSFPDLSFISEIQGILLTIAGFLGIEVARTHREDKNEN